MVKTRRFRGGKKSKRHTHHKHHSTHRRKVKRYNRRGTKRRRRKRTKRLKRGGARKSVMKGGAYYVINDDDGNIVTDIDTGGSGWWFGTTDPNDIKEKLNARLPANVQLNTVELIEKGKEYDGTITTPEENKKHVTIMRYKNYDVYRITEDKKREVLGALQEQKRRVRSNLLEQQALLQQQRGAQHDPNYTATGQEVYTPPSGGPRPGSSGDTWNLRPSPPPTPSESESESEDD